MSSVDCHQRTLLSPSPSLCLSLSHSHQLPSFLQLTSDFCIKRNALRKSTKGERCGVRGRSGDCREMRQSSLTRLRRALTRASSTLLKAAQRRRLSLTLPPPPYCQQDASLHIKHDNSSGATCECIKESQLQHQVATAFHKHTHTHTHT